MPEIEVRALLVTDLPSMQAIDHDYVSDHVWQMNVQEETGASPTDLQIHVNFRQVHLPRSVHVVYPRSAAALAEDWKKRVIGRGDCGLHQLDAEYRSPNELGDRPGSDPALSSTRDWEWVGPSRASLEPSEGQLSYGDRDAT
jgi:hypothetical protein